MENLNALVISECKIYVQLAQNKPQLSYKKKLNNQFCHRTQHRPPLIKGKINQLQVKPVTSNVQYRVLTNSKTKGKSAGGK